MNIRLFPLFAILLFYGAHVSATIRITHINTDTPRCYEKYEVVYDLLGLSYDNPYDPEQIDITATFTSPSGVEWRVFGFYDDHNGANKWKIRFSPNEVGQWCYIIRATDATSSDESDLQSFTAVTSDHHGWIKASAANPRYLQYDDGAGFYGVGMYTPWRNSVNTFDTLKRFGGNTFAIWNITYGGIVNGFGLIEEELGRYNQTKCGKIDELIEVAEARDLIIMYCFWPHDLFSNTVWAHQWHINPYRLICDVQDVYSDETCWSYQEKQYRYLIARFSYSRSWGIWEIMNEINGTDGWEAGRHEEAKDWVKKVHDYFKANDPYQHLTTASRSGGFTEYWPQMYELVDLPNLHVYETQGWSEEFPGNTLRSSMRNYAFAAARFWQNYAQPGIFGEAGADWVRVDVRSPEYEALYHNAIWATLTNGLAATPYWWTFTDPIRDEERAHMLHLSRFVADIDFIRDSKEHFERVTDDYDLYGMQGDSTAFAWLRQVNGLDASALQFELDGLLHPDIPVYAVSYFNTWTGEPLATHVRPHLNGRLRDVTPALPAAVPDVAFKITPAQGGDVPARLELSSDSNQTLNIDTLMVPISCYLFDALNRFCPAADALITFTLDGPGTLIGPAQVAATGAAAIVFQPSAEPGVATIIASSPGLVADTLTIRVQDRVILDDFESYGSDAALRSKWLLKSGEADLSLDAQHGTGRSLRVDYGIGPEYKYTVVIEKEIRQSFQGGQFLTFWIQSDGSNRDVEIRIYDVNRKYWEYTFPLVNANAGLMTIPLCDFEARDPAIPFDLTILATIRLTLRVGEGEYGSGTLYFDDFKFPATAPMNVKSGDAVPAQFALEQNYPNPFNAATRIAYRLPQRTRVQLAVYNAGGQEVETLVDAVQEAGQHVAVWTSRADLSSGVYFYRLRAADFIALHKCMLLK